MTDYPPVLAIVGSRRYPKPDDVTTYLLELPQRTVIVSGGGGTVDLTARITAQEHGHPTVEFVPMRTDQGFQVERRNGPKRYRLRKVYRHFAAAAHARNDMIIRYCVENEGGVTVFIDRSQRTPGSLSMIEKATKAGVLFEVRELKAITT